MKPIPVDAARQVAESYGYDQVIIVARKVGDGGGEHCTTYGRDKAHCDVAARCGEFLKHKVMGWHRDQTVVHEEHPEIARLRAALKDAVGYIQVDRDQLYECITNKDGEYDNEDDERIIRETDELLDRLSAALAGGP